MKINPVKGTADYLPSQARVRDYLQKVILDTYRAAGFERIMTPAIEDMENLAALRPDTAAQPLLCGQPFQAI